MYEKVPRIRTGQDCRYLSEMLLRMASNAAVTTSTKSACHLALMFVRRLNSWKKLTASCRYNIGRSSPGGL